MSPPIIEPPRRRAIKLALPLALISILLLLQALSIAVQHQKWPLTIPIISKLTNKEIETSQKSNTSPLKPIIPQLPSTTSKTTKSTTNRISKNSSSLLNHTNPNHYSGITIWRPSNPQLCTGHFQSNPAVIPGHKTTLPYIMIRDAVIDRRHASIEEYQTYFAKTSKDPRSFLRIVLYVTAHLSVNLVQKGSRCLLKGGRGASGVTTLEELNIQCRVDYVMHTTKFRLRRGKYRPGGRTAKTRYGKEVSEWQVIISMVRDKEGGEMGQDVLEKLVDGGVVLGVELPMDRYDGKKIVFQGNLTMGCVLSWELNGPFSQSVNRFEKRPGNCEDARGSVAITGSALHGHKKANPDKLIDVAQFAARMLLGSVQFDTVAITVVTDWSASEIEYNCQGNSTCVDSHHEQNNQLLRKVAKITADELEILGVPEDVLSRIVVIPFCRLGSDYSGKEQGDPCASSFWSAQYHATYLGYTLVGPYHKWAMLLDVDEFVAENKNFAIFRHKEEASKLLDRYNQNGGFLFSWLNFRFRTLNDTRNITRDVMSSKKVALRIRGDKLNFWTKRQDCYAWPRVKTGKAAVHCKAGLGFTIHAAVRKKSGGRLNNPDRNTRIATRDVRTWHARRGSATSNCEYASEGKR